MKERPFATTLLLYIVTLGIYGYVWYYRSHDELARQMGVRNDDKTIFWMYVATAPVVLILGVFLLVRLTMAESSLDEGAIIGLMTEFVVFVVVALLIGIAAIALLLMYVVRQFRLIAHARAHVGLPASSGAGHFFGFYLGGVAAAMVPFVGWIGQIVLMVLAYQRFVQHYHDIYQRVANGAQNGPLPFEGTKDLPAGPAHVPSTATGTPSGHPVSQTGTAGGTAGSMASVGMAAAPTAAAHATPHVRRTYQCPSCSTPVTAEGQPGTTVALSCTSCSHAGSVRLPA